MSRTEDSGPTADAVLELRQVSKVFSTGHRALDDVDLAIRKGETLALVGESGSGKTTLLRLLNRSEEPSSGEVLRDGVPLRQLDPFTLRRRTGYVEQLGGLLPHWTVERNVCLVPQLLGWDRARQRERAQALLELVGLEPAIYAARYPRSLSGGQRQRVAFARALVTEPPVVLLDEPFGALDAITRHSVHTLFRALQRRFRPTSLLVTHDLDEACALADRVAVLQGGRLLQCASPEALAHAPASPYVAELLAHRRQSPASEAAP